MFRKRREEKRMMVDVDYRLNPEEILSLLSLFALITYPLAWTSFFLLSFLYLLCFLSLLTFFAIGQEVKMKNRRRWSLISIAMSLLFFTFSLSPQAYTYAIGAYLSSLSSPVVLHFLMRRG